MATSIKEMTLFDVIGNFLPCKSVQNKYSKQKAWNKEPGFYGY